MERNRDANAAMPAATSTICHVAGSPSANATVGAASHRAPKTGPATCQIRSHRRVLGSVEFMLETLGI